MKFNALQGTNTELFLVSLNSTSKNKIMRHVCICIFFPL